jgi:AcrR family transcriptional regulator
MKLDPTIARPPKQLRSQQTLERILLAAEELLREKCFDDVSVAEIVARAHSSSGSFYARFPDKRALLHALHERFGERVRLETDALLAPERWERTSTQELIEEVVKHLVVLFEAHDGVLRAALSEAVRDHSFTERATTIALGVRERLRDLLEPRRPEMKITGFEESFDIGFRMVLATLDQRLFLGRLHDRTVARESRKLTAQLSIALVRILGIAPALQET